MGNGSSSGHHQHQHGGGSFRRPHGEQYGYQGEQPVTRRQISRKYSFIPDNYKTLEQVQNALRAAGLESSNLIVGVDFTKSNEWTGRRTFGGRSLHSIGEGLNPYESAISIIGRTLAPFDDDNLIPCYGFGDATTHDTHCFSFLENDRPCNGFQEVLHRYRFIAPHVRLAGPTSFAPVIEAACRMVESQGGQYHVLIIIADGQVTRGSDIEAGQWSQQEQATINAIVAASNFALSIILVGVGDGPWEQMKYFDDNLPERVFDNFQFVDYSSMLAKGLPDTLMEAQFALAALMEIPEQYKACVELGLLGRKFGRMPPNVPLPPPPSVIQAERNAAFQAPPSFPAPYPSAPGLDVPSRQIGGQLAYQGQQQQQQQSSGGGWDAYGGQAAGAAAAGMQAGGTPGASEDVTLCPICFLEPRNMAFGCGHRTCTDCASHLNECPICRAPITTRLRLY